MGELAPPASYNCVLTEHETFNGIHGDEQMHNVSQLMGALIGAVIISGCDANSPLPTSPTSRNAARSVSATEDKKLLNERNDAQIVRATGDIASAVDQFRALLGPLRPNVAGDSAGGRREINWDGVPAKFTNNDSLPGNFFNVTSPRGVLFTTNGSAFSISNDGYIEVNSAYAGEFNFFSPAKLFVARGGTVVDVQFVVAGSNTPALVTGFGSVFADVGRSHSTTIEFFDVAGTRLLKIAAPRRSDDKGLSFAGAVFDKPIVARVRITSGDTPIGANVTDNVNGYGKKRDLVAMDDFIYGEPRHIN
jgi:hypothetical protein